MLRKALIDAGLSPRETEVALVVATGASNKEVANGLFVTEKTVKFHLTNIYAKMRLKSRSQLIVWSAKHLSFEESNPVLIPSAVAVVIDAHAPALMPVGTNKIGNA